MLKEMKNAFDRLTKRLDTAKERIGELEDRSMETFYTEMQRKKIILKRTEHSESVGQYKKV